MQYIFYKDIEERKNVKILNWNCKGLYAEKICIKHVRTLPISFAYRIPYLQSTCYSTFLIKDYVLFAVCTVNTHAIAEGHQLLTPTVLRPRPRSCATPFRRRHRVAGCERNPSVTDAVFLPFAWAGSILRRKLHRLLQRCLKRENVMPLWMELSPLITLRETLSLPRNV